DDQLTKLAYAGALSPFGLTRRSALWQAAKAAKPAGELFQRTTDNGQRTTSPLPEMSVYEETLADYAAMELTTGPHLVEHLRGDLNRHRILSAIDLKRVPPGQRVT